MRFILIPVRLACSPCHDEVNQSAFRFLLHYASSGQHPACDVEMSSFIMRPFARVGLNPDLEGFFEQDVAFCFPDYADDVDPNSRVNLLHNIVDLTTVFSKSVLPVF